MKKARSLAAVFLALTLIFAMVPASFAAETAAPIKIGDVSVTFSSGYSVDQKNINLDGDIPIMGDVYHVNQDCVITMNYAGKGSWSANYRSDDGTADYKVQAVEGKEVKAKYLDSAANAKSFWDGSAKDVLPVIEKTGAVLQLKYKDAQGYESGETFYLNFDGKGTVSTPQTGTPTVTPPATTPVAAPSGTLKTTGGLYGALPSIPTPGQDLQYMVLPHETLVGIAFNYYGTMSAKAVYKIKNANAAYFKKTKGVLEAYAVITLPKAGLINPVSPASLNNAAGAYLVKRGDTLSDIAKVYYGDRNAWKKIYEANKSRVKLVGKSPMIYETQWLIIPN